MAALVPAPLPPATDASMSSVDAYAAGLPMYEPPTRLRDSALWALQTSFYDTPGVWREGVVPSFATSNAFIARAYARVLLGAMIDLTASTLPDPASPLYILELGAGSGKLGFLILTELLAMRDEWPPSTLPCPFVYVMTDASARSLEFWRAHERLAPFFANGMLDCGLFDAERDTSVKLAGSGVTLARGTGGVSVRRNPLLVIANYVFDSLRQDALRFNDGVLEEGRVALYLAPDPEPLNGAPPPPAIVDGAPAVDPALIRRLRCVWSFAPLAPEDGYRDRFLSAASRYYGVLPPTSTGATVLMPVGGITAVANLAALSGGQLLLIAGDKAFTTPDEMAGCVDPHVALHGSFSFMANFHALRMYTLARGGFALSTPAREGFKVGAFFIGLGGGAPLPGGLPVHSPSEVDGPPPVNSDLGWLAAADDAGVPQSALSAFPTTLLSWADNMDGFGPDAASTLQRCGREEVPIPSLPLALAMLRSCAWEGDVFFKFRAAFIDGVPTVSDRLAQDISGDVAAVAARLYPLSPDKDVSFDLARVCMGLKDYNRAIALFGDSLRLAGDHETTRYNQGICWWFLGDLAKARASFLESLALKPSYSDAQLWLSRAEAALVGKEEPVVGGGGGGQ